MKKMGTKWEPKSGTRMVTSGDEVGPRTRKWDKNGGKVGTRKWDKNEAKVGTKSGNKVGTRTSKWDKNANKVGTKWEQEP